MLFRALIAPLHTRRELYMKKSILSIALVLLLMLATFPTGVYADDDGYDDLNTVADIVAVKLDDVTQAEFDSLTDFGVSWMHVAFKNSI